jgi:ComF family protein
MRAQVYESLLGFIIPELCLRCGGPSKAGFCAGCRGDFVANEGYCRICGLSPEPANRAACAAHSETWHTAAVRVPYVYCEPIARHIHELKFGGQRKLGRALGLLLALEVFALRSDTDALVAVPLHGARLRERGYNQALEIARAVSFELRLPVIRSGIARQRNTSAQSSLSAAERRTNLASAFRVDRALNGARLAIIDDVVTTGATVNALAAALLGSGAARVEAWAVARTSRPSATVSALPSQQC